MNAAAPSKRFVPPQISLRMLFAIVLLLVLPIAWFAKQFHGAREQLQTVHELQSLGAACFFDYQMSAANARPTVPPKPLHRYQHWSARFLGENLWAGVAMVEFYPTQIDEDALERLLAMGKHRTIRWSQGLMKVRQRESQPKRQPRMSLFPPLIRPNTVEPPAQPDTLRFGDADMHLLARLRDLETLNLGYTYITDAGLPHLVRLRKLTQLGLQGTDVGDKGMEHVGKLTQLQELHLNYTRVTDPGLAHLRNLKDLKTLLIWGTRIGDAGVAHLTSLKKLRVLVLSETQISDAGVALLETMSSLEHVNVKRTRVTCVGHRSLKQALPNCRVVPKYR